MTLQEQLTVANFGMTTIQEIRDPISTYGRNLPLSGAADNMPVGKGNYTRNEK
jgi:hypothetical protein